MKQDSRRVHGRRQERAAAGTVAEADETREKSRISRGKRQASRTVPVGKTSRSGKAGIAEAVAAAGKAQGHAGQAPLDTLQDASLKCVLFSLSDIGHT